MKQFLLLSILLGNIGFIANARAMDNDEKDHKAQNTIPVAKKEEDEFTLPFWTPEVQCRNERVVIAKYYTPSKASKAQEHTLKNEAITEAGEKNNSEK